MLPVLLVHQCSLFGDEPVTIIAGDLAEPSLDDPNRDAAQRGRSIEFLVCYELSRAGFYVVHDNEPGYDLSVRVDDRARRVQVKSSTQVVGCSYRWHVGAHKQREAFRGGSRGKWGPLTRDHADLLCLYHWDAEAFVFLPIDRPIFGVTFKAAAFRSSDWRRTLRAACAQLRANA